MGDLQLVDITVDFTEVRKPMAGFDQLKISSDSCSLEVLCGIVLREFNYTFIISFCFLPPRAFRYLLQLVNIPQGNPPTKLSPILVLTKKCRVLIVFLVSI